MAIYVDRDPRTPADRPVERAETRGTGSSAGYRSIGGQFLLVGLAIVGAIPVVGMIGLAVLVWLGSR